MTKNSTVSFDVRYVALNRQVWQEIKQIFGIEEDYQYEANFLYDAEYGGCIQVDGKNKYLFSIDEEEKVIKFCEKYNIPWVSTSRIEIKFVGKNGIPKVRLRVYPWSTQAY